MKSGMNEVTFKSQQVDLAGLLFTPENFDPTKKYPTVVFSGPLTQVKEQMGTDYGKAFAKIGYILLSFDHLGQGSSKAYMGPNENSNYKMEGIRDAISYLRTLDFVDKDRLFGLGGCASGGYMPLVAVTDKRLKGLATVSGMPNNIAVYFGSMDRETLINTFTQANEARQRMYETGEIETIDATNFEGTQMEDWPEGMLREGHEYYMTERGRKGGYTHMQMANFVEYTPLADATAYAPYIFMPYIGVVGEHAESAVFTRNFYNNAEEPKELAVIEGATHISLYDNEAQIKEAVERIDAFWSKSLK